MRQDYAENYFCITGILSTLPGVFEVAAGLFSGASITPFTSLGFGIMLTVVVAAFVAVEGAAGTDGLGV